MNDHIKQLLQAVLAGKEFEDNDWGNDWEDCNVEHVLYKIGLERADQIRIKDKFSELKKKHAKGAIIQYYDSRGYWENCEDNSPEWFDNVKYRVKPTPKPDYSKFIGLGVNSYELTHTSGVYQEKQHVPKQFSGGSTVYNTKDIIELVYDGETNKLKNTIIHSKE